ncbi:MAG: sulfotransferase [Porticoccaceae bacterium]
MAAKKPNKKFDKFALKAVVLTLPDRGQAAPVPAHQALTTAKTMAANRNWLGVATICRQITAQAPGYADAWLVLFDALHQLNDFVSLQEAASQCLGHKLRWVPALVALATACRMLQEYEQALASIEKAVTLEPSNARALNHLGIIEKELGLFERALATFNRCIALRPEDGEPYWNRSDLLRDVREKDIAQMAQLLIRSQLSAANQVRLHYALGRAYEFSGDYALAFQHIEKGATLKRQLVNYDHGQQMAEMAQIPGYFTAEVLAATAEFSAPKPVQSATGAIPVFICGLPRSGTTLVEQILSSHPQVTAGDELTDLPRATSDVLKLRGVNTGFPQWAAELNDSEWRAIGDRYRALTGRLQTTGYFTDKNLQNYKAIGLIHRALPEAKIVFCRRNAMDTIWGCYRQLFGDGLGFTYSLDELADTYMAANRLLTHWQAQPTLKICVLDYETLVANPEGETRRLLEFVGLDWHPACLDFHNNSRAVRTTSATQVRRPINSQRIGQWLKYESQLGELLAKNPLFGN